jgi:hypothetical protein
MQPAPASLTLVRPSDLRWLFKTIGSEQRIRALFRLGTNQYNLSLTNPPVEEELKSLPDGIHSLAAIGLREDRLLVWISLGEVFTDGSCYKLVAGVI